MSKQNLSSIEKGTTRRFSGATSVAIAQYLGVAVADVVNELTPRRMRGMKAIEYGPAIQRHLPLITWKQVGAWVKNQENVSTKDVEATYPCPIACSARSFVLRVRGPSMEPAFRSGELIFVDPAVEPTDGRFVIVEGAGSTEPELRQLIYEGPKRFLKSVNPAWPGPLIELADPIRILGVVIFRGEPV